MAHPSNHMLFPVSDSIGSVSAILQTPAQPEAIVLLAHGAGAGMTHAFMESLADELVNRSLVVLRFNFPYMEAGKRRPDVPAVAEKTVGEVIKKATALFPALPLFAGGKSFGGRMTSQLLSKKNNVTAVRGIVFFGFPLHPAGKPSTDRAKHLQDVTIPMLFHQGTRDTLAEINMVEDVCKGLKGTTLIRYEGADHSFKISKRNNIPELAANTSVWIKHVLALAT
jgi:uncharacterized protein